MADQEKNGKLEEYLLARRIVVIEGYLDRDCLKKAMRQIVLLAIESKNEIKLVIDTVGGNCQPTFEFYDRLQLIDVPITGIVCGQCASMGIIVLMACLKRLAMLHSKFVVHSPDATYEYNAEHGDDELTNLFVDHLHQTRKFYQKYWNIIMTQTGQTMEKFESLIHKGNRNLAFSAEEAKEIGLIEGFYSGKLF